MPLDPRQVLWVILGSAAILSGIGLAIGGWFPAVGGAAIGAMVPVLLLKSRWSARRSRYLQQLGGAFDQMARVLRSGQSVAEAFRAVVGGFGEPLTGEFARCLHQIEHGLRPEAAFRELSRRSGILELRIFVVAMTIQAQSGGNLSEMLERMGQLVKARPVLKQKLRGLTAEGRLQSLTLTVLPVLTFAVMYFLNRQYAEMLLQQGKLLAATAGGMTVGVLWINSIMKIED